MPSRQAIIERIGKQDWRNTDAAVLDRVYAAIEPPQASMFAGPRPAIEYTDYRGQRVPIGFLRWWKVYPKKVGGLGKCASAWLSKGLEQRSQEMVDAVNRQKAHRNRQQDAGAFVPDWKDAIRWLKDERWTDELDDSVGGGPRTDLERMDALAPDIRQRLHEQATGGDIPNLAGLPASDPMVRRTMALFAKEGGLL